MDGSCQKYNQTNLKDQLVCTQLPVPNLGSITLLTTRNVLQDQLMHTWLPVSDLSEEKKNQKQWYKSETMTVHHSNKNILTNQV